MSEQVNHPQHYGGKTVVGAVMPSCLRLSLKTKWFEMTKAGVKTEYFH